MCGPSGGGLFDVYIEDRLAEADAASFTRHAGECLACAAHVANARSIRAASEHYGIRLDVNHDLSQSIKQLRLTVVDLTGEPLVQKYRLALNCRSSAGTSSIE